MVEVVGCSWDALWNYNSKGKLLAPLNYLKQKRAISESEYAIYVTSNFLQKRYPTRGDSINCSNVLLSNFDDSILINRTEKVKCRNLESTLVIGTTAAVDVKYKGQRSVIKALGKLKERGITNFEYQLVGSGEQKSLRLIAEKYAVTEQVKFLGAMPHKDVLNWLDSIDIYAQPSKTEGLPRGLIEAMSRGLFAMGSNVGGIPELLDEEYIFNKSNNEEEICNILIEINKDKLLEQARRNFNVAKEYDQSLIESRRQLFLRKFVSQK